MYLVLCSLCCIYVQGNQWAISLIKQHRAPRKHVDGWIAADTAVRLFSLFTIVGSESSRVESSRV
jgi:hypothetical protein